MLKEIELKVQSSYVSYLKLEPTQCTKVPRENIGKCILPFFATLIANYLLFSQYAYITNFKIII